MTLDEKAAALLMLHAPGVESAPLRSLVDLGVSGLILMGDNVPATSEQLAELTAGVQSGLEVPVLFAIDEEGGIVQRLPWDPVPGADVVRDGAVEVTEQAFSDRAELLAAGGVNVNFGIVADVTADPDSFIFDRVLGTEPGAAADRVAAAVRGESPLVASTLKHFPGHGAAPGDSHESIPSADLDASAWSSGPAVPFAAGIDAGAPLVMTGHLEYPAIDADPASLSAEWHRLLRDDLGFEGVIVTDDMLMLQNNGLAEYSDPYENAVRALEAGSDLLLYVLPADPSDVGIEVAALVTAIGDAVRSGRISEETIDESVTRILTLRYSFAD